MKSFVCYLAYSTGNYTQGYLVYLYQILCDFY